MEILDTLSNKKQVLELPKKGFLRLFVCGPTVYDFPHIGHARTYIVFDTFVRFLRSQKIKVFYLQNITDVDDKIIERAKETNKNPLELAKFFEAEYKKIMKKIGIDSVDKYARATDHIPQIQKQIATLLKKYFAYETDNGIYFEVKKAKSYGKLSKQSLDQLRPGWRIEPDPQKKDPLDFSLWKKSNPKSQTLNSKQNQKSKFQILDGEPMWQSPWGWGRPGWHIEDTAIAEKFFGPQYDIHGGGMDLKFPHHESEIAQMESASGKKPFVKIWMHTGFLLVDDKKMSKSLKNFISISDFLKNNSPAVLRMLILSSHYRSPINYTDELILQTKNSLQNIKEFLGKLHLIILANNKKSSSFEINKLIEVLDSNFTEALENDFNTPKALSVIFDMISSWQNQIWQFDKDQAKAITKLIKAKLDILGIRLELLKIPKKVKDLAKKRDLLRKDKQFIPADLLRNKIEKLGYSVEDTPLGPLLLKISNF
ncbi:MAG: cysteine--tRNA ligase [Candidatus Paceibacterota bacterium]|jgi:cysteinyl-tRNA synthetase